MKILNTIIATLTVILSVELANSFCEANTEIQNLMQDSLTIRLDKSRYKHTYNYPAVLFPNKNPKIALSLTKMQVKQLANIEYHIATIFGSGGSVIFYLIFPSQTAKWRQIRLKLWLIGQQMQDLSVGHILFENIDASSHKSALITHKQQPLLDKLNKQLASDPRVFISTILGLSAVFTMDYLEIKNDGAIKTSLVNGQKQYEIEFTVQSGLHSVIKLIRFCYVLYAPSRLSTTHHHYITLSKQLNALPNGNNELIVSHLVLQEALRIYPLKYFILGITGLKLTNLQTFSLSMSIQAGNIDLIQLQSFSKIDFVAINCLVLGVDMMMSCIHCPDSFVKSTGQADICVSKYQCSDNQIALVDRDAIYYSCRNCLANSIVLKRQDGLKHCGCPAGYTLQPDQTCRKVEIFKSLFQCSDPNSIRDPATGRCICKQGFYPDDFGFCGGMCNYKTSYWDLNTEKCVCFQGFEFNAIDNACVQKGKSCDQNQIFIDGKCQCDGFTVKTQYNSQIKCEQCGSGTYKADDANECRKCDTTCKQCISSVFCLACTKGFYFRDFRCWARCGDGIKIGTELCDDGNLADGDGCSSACKIQNEYECKQNHDGKSLCSNKQSYKQVINTNPQKTQNKAELPQSTSSPLSFSPAEYNSQVKNTSKTSQLSPTSGTVLESMNAQQQASASTQKYTTQQIARIQNQTKIQRNTLNATQTKSASITNSTGVSSDQSNGYITKDQSFKRQQSQISISLNAAPSTIATKDQQNHNQSRTQNSNKDIKNTTSAKMILSQGQANTTQPQIDPKLFRLSVSKNSPIYLSSGIALQLLVKPEKKRTQDELNNMFKIQVSDKRALPPAIYISQDSNKLSSIRCYLHYNNQLPALDFSIKVWAKFSEEVWKTLTLYSKVFAKMSRSIKPMDDDNYIL